MAVTVKYDPISRDIALALADLSAPLQSKAIADYAETAIEEAKQINQAALGKVPPYKTYVDGRLDAPLESVRPNGVIFTEFELVIDVLRYIGEQLVLNSPVETGRYRRSHILLADGVEIDPAAQLTQIADEYVFINSQPYARKIERGESPEAPDGVYQATATLARRRFGNVARISFSYRDLIGGFASAGPHGARAKNRQPAILVSIR